MTLVEWLAARPKNRVTVLGGAVQRAVVLTAALRIGAKKSPERGFCVRQTKIGIKAEGQTRGRSAAKGRAVRRIPAKGLI